jgi:DNA-binding NarL/FixJ family response regulator
MKDKVLTDNKPPTTLWLIEDDEPYRNAIAAVIDNADGMMCERAFPSCEPALDELHRESPPDVLLMDIVLPGMSGIEGVRQFKSISPSTHIIMVTVFQDDEKVFQSICAGATGYLLKTAPAMEIVEAIRTVLNGGAPMNARIAHKVLDMIAHANAPQTDYRLTNREKEILHLIVEGLTLKQAADKAFLSHHTVDTHVRNIYSKLQVHSRASLVAKAMKEKL